MYINWKHKLFLNKKIKQINNPLICWNMKLFLGQNKAQEIQ